jgi:hypothetical protein
MTCDVHHVPGRIRFKIPGLRNDRTLIGALPRALTAYDGVDRVEVRPESNSLIVHYDPSRIDCRHLAQSVNRGLSVNVRHPVNGARPADHLPPPRQSSPIDGDFVLGSVRHMGIVFGRTAFKVALEQAVRGSLNSLFRVTLGRN